MRIPVLTFLALTTGCSQVAGEPKITFEQITNGDAITDEYSTGGSSAVDIDGDGTPEIITTNGYNVIQSEPVPYPNRVYRLDRTLAGQIIEIDGFEPMTGFSSGSTWADMDGDGDLDVYITNQRDQRNLLLIAEKTGQGTVRFREAPQSPATQDGNKSFSSTWIDLDGDGLLDLFVANGGLSQAERNAAYRNLGGGQFERIEIEHLTTRENLTAGSFWADYDNDGDLDVFFTHSRPTPDGPPDHVVFRNDGSLTFTEVELPNTPTNNLSATSAAWGDYDGDGDLDLYVGNWAGFSNTLYRNDGNDRFSLLTNGPHLLDGGRTSVVQWIDLNNDMDLDLVVADWGGGIRFYMNDGAGIFSRAHVPNADDFLQYSSGLAMADFDKDGRIDLYFGAWPNLPGAGQRNSLLMNRSESGNWIKIKLEGQTPNTSAVGARITLMANGKSQIREILAQSNFRSQSEYVQTIGLGESTHADILIRWPSGRTQECRDLDANTLHVISINESMVC